MDERAMPRSWWVATWLGLWALLAVLLVPHNLDPTVTQWGRFSFFDYRDTVWVPIRDFLAGGIPWDTAPYLRRHPGIQSFVLYLPHYWWAAWPLALLPYGLSVGLWLGFTSAAMVLLVVTGFRFSGADLRTRPWLVPACTLALLVSRPVRSALFQGQLAVPCAAAAILALLQSRETRTGLLATLVGLIKPPVGLPLLAVQFLTGRRRTAVRALAVATIACLPVLLTVLHRAGGVANGMHVLLASLRDGSGTESTPFTYVDLHGLPSDIMASPPAWLVVFCVLVAVLLTLPAAVVAKRELGMHDPRYLMCSSLALVLITPTMLYGLVALVPAAVALAVRCWNAPGQRRLSAVQLILLAVPMMTPGGALAVLGLGTDAQNAVNCLCVAAVAGIAAGEVWELARRAPDPAHPRRSSSTTPAPANETPEKPDSLKTV